MFDRRSASENFRRAVGKLVGSKGNSGSIQELALMFRIPLIADIKIDDDAKLPGNVETFQADNGADWSSVLNGWLDACEASAKVLVIWLYQYSSYNMSHS
jgi:hypothetical protein